MIGVETRTISVDDRRSGPSFSPISNYDCIRPVQNGLVKDWDMLERVFDHMLHNELRVDPAEYNLMLTMA